MEYSGSRYDGPQESGRAEGVGTYVFPNGSRYVGGFKNGMFDGEGTMYIPGCGAYTAVWREGRKVKGSYTFADGLEYKSKDWGYCTNEDRRFETEIKRGIKPAGQDQLTNNENGDPRLENGQADVGDGYTTVRNGDGQVRDFETGEVKRYLENGEKKWIYEKCRLGPSGTVGRSVEAALRSLFLQNDVDGKNSLSHGELVEIIRMADKKVLESNPEKYSSVAKVLEKLGNSNPDECLTLDGWLSMWSL